MLAELETPEGIFICSCCGSLVFPASCRRQTDLPEQNAFACCINTPQCQNSTMYITTCRSWLPAGGCLESWHLWSPTYLLMLCCHTLLLDVCCVDSSIQRLDLYELCCWFLTGKDWGTSLLLKSTILGGQTLSIPLERKKTHHMMKTEKPTKTRKVQLMPIMANVQKLISPSPKIKVQLKAEAEFLQKTTLSLYFSWSDPASPGK